MLSLFTRRVALSAYRSTATYARISASSAPTLRGRGLPDTSLHSNTVPAFTNPQRNVSTEAAVATKKTKSSAESTTGGRRKSQRNLTPEQKAARKQLLQAKRELDNKKKAERAVALEVKRKARAEKEKEAAALKRKRLAEKAEKERKRKKAEAKAEKAEAKKPRSAHIVVSCLHDVSYSMVSVACTSHQTSSEAHEPVLVVPPRNKETP